MTGSANNPAEIRRNDIDYPFNYELSNETHPIPSLKIPTDENTYSDERFASNVSQITESTLPDESNNDDLNLSVWSNPFVSLKNEQLASVDIENIEENQTNDLEIPEILNSTSHYSIDPEKISFEPAQQTPEESLDLNGYPPPSLSNPVVEEGINPAINELSASSEPNNTVLSELLPTSNYLDTVLNLESIKPNIISNINYLHEDDQQSVNHHSELFHAKTDQDNSDISFVLSQGLNGQGADDTHAYQEFLSKSTESVPTSDSLSDIELYGNQYSFAGDMSNVGTSAYGGHFKSSKKHNYQPKKLKYLPFLVVGSIIFIGLLFICLFPNVFSFQSTILDNLKKIEAKVNPNPNSPVSKVAVIGHEWSRSGSVGYYKTSNKEGWELPADAELIKSTQVIHHYEKTLDHYETKEHNVRTQVGTLKVLKERRDLGNGKYEDIYETRPAYTNKVESEEVPVYTSKPVYRTKYVYRSPKWITTRSFDYHEKNNKPYWPQLTQSTQLGNITQDYLLLVKLKDGQEAKVSVGFERWQRINPGESVEIQQTDKGYQIVE